MLSAISTHSSRSMLPRIDLNGIGGLSYLIAPCHSSRPSHWQDLDLRTVWDDELCYLLSPALAAYELERCVGVSVGNEEFQEAIRNVVPEGHTFKGFPIQLVHRNPRKAFSACLK